MIIKLIKNIFSYIIHFFKMAFKYSKTEIINNKNKPNSNQKKFKDKVFLGSIPNDDSIKTIFDFKIRPNISKDDFLKLYLESSTKEIKELEEYLKEVTLKIINQKDTLGYTFELNIIETRIKKLMKQYAFVKNNFLFKKMTIELKEIDKYNLYKNDNAIIRLQSMHNYIKTIKFKEDKKDTQKKVILKEKEVVSFKKDEIIKEQTKNKQEKKSFIQAKKINAKLNQENKKEEVKRTNKNLEKTKYDDVFESIDSVINNLKTNKKIYKQAKKRKKSIFNPFFILCSLIDATLLRIQLNKIKNELRREYIDAININNDIITMNNIVSDIELDYISANINSLINLNTIQKETVNIKLNTLLNIRMVKQEIEVKYPNNKKSSRLLNRLSEIEKNMEYNIKEMPEITKIKSK